MTADIAASLRSDARLLANTPMNLSLAEWGIICRNMLAAAQGQNQYNMGLYNSDVASSNSMTSGMMSAAASIAAMI